MKSALNTGLIRALILVTLCLLTRPASAILSDLNEESLGQIGRIARAISVVNPHLPDGKYVEYGLYIYRAAMKYRIEPAILIAIAQQETGFRNDLPEGKAGEFGIVQIRKMWLKQATFLSEFKRATIKDLRNPGKSFLYAAWLLKQLKNASLVRSRSLPYWSYYNSVRFENRFKYFLAVNQYISKLRKHEDFFSSRAVAVQTGNSEQPALTLGAGAYRSPVNDSVGLALAKWVPGSSGTRGSSVKSGHSRRWIPEAMLKLEKSGLAKKQPTPASDEKVVRAASDLSLKDFYSKAQLPD